MKKLLLVTDVRGWAWWHMAQGIAKYAPEEYEVQVITNGDFHQYTKITPGALMEFDGICQFSWVESTTPGKNGIHWDYATTVVASHGLEFDYPPKNPDYLPSRIATQLRNRLNAAKRLPQFDRVICVSHRLQALASDYNRESVFCMPGVDTEIFKPPKRKSTSSRLRVGWCGHLHGVTKGYDEVLVPLMKRLGEERYDWRIVRQEPNTALSQVEMVKWFQGLDVLISTSFSEGNQQPIMESMACGVPVIATDCGMADETAWAILTAPKSEAEYERTYRAFARALEAFSNTTADEMRMERAFCRDEAEKRFSWRTCAENWCKSIAGENL